MSAATARRFRPVALGLALALATVPARGANVAVDDAARLVQGVNASVQYQLYRPNPASTPQKIDVAMAPVLSVIKNGLIAGVNTTDLLALHAAAVANAQMVVANTSPKEQVGIMFDFMKTLVFQDPNTAKKLAFDLAKAEVTAAINLSANSSQLSRTEVFNPLQSLYSQQQIDKFYTKLMGDAHDIAASNSSFAQNFDLIFQNDFGVSVKDNATTILNKNLNIPGYFQASANPDGSLSVTIDGLKTVARPGNLWVTCGCQRWD